MRGTDTNSSKIKHLLQTKWKVSMRRLDGVMTALLLLTYKQHKKLLAFSEDEKTMIQK